MTVSDVVASDGTPVIEPVESEVVVRPSSPKPLSENPKKGLLG